MSEADLRQRISNCALHIEDTRLAKERDEKLQDVTAELKELRAPYAETTKFQKTVMQYATLLLQQKDI